MTRTIITIRNEYDRVKVAELARKLLVGQRVEIKESQRTHAQNRKFWSMLNDLSHQVMWHGRRLTEEQWKYVILDALRRQQKLDRDMVPSIDGIGFAIIGRSSADLSVDEMGDCVTIMQMFGANHGVKFHDTESNSADPIRQDAPAVAVPEAHIGDALPSKRAAGVTKSQEQKQ